MTDLIWTASLLLLAAAGLFVWRAPDIAAIDLPGRLSVAFSTGLVVTSVVLYLESMAGIPWSRTRLAVPLVVIGAAGAWWWKRAASWPERLPWPWSAAAAFSFVALLCLYGAATARLTIADLLYFWGPKAVHFLDARAIDVELLKFPHYYLMHPDYPPLVPLTWAASGLVAGTISYWGALYGSAALLIAAALALRGFAAGRLGAQTSAAFAVLLLAILTLATTAGSAAGGGDPYLLLFEAVALSALTFSDHRGAKVVAAIALAGAGFAKVEGAAFVACIALALSLTGRIRTALQVTLPAAALIGSWIAFASHHELLDSYWRAGRRAHFDNLGLVTGVTMAEIHYGSFYLPWIAALAPLAAGRSIRRAALPLLVGAGSIGCALFFYVHEPQPIWWIRASAERVMMTALLCFVVASAAASE